MRWLRLTLLLLSGALLCQGCSNPAQKVIEANRAETQANLDRAAQLAELVSQAPPVSEAGFKVSAPTVFVSVAKDDVPTAVFIHAEDLSELLSPVAKPERVYGADLLPECASLLTRGKHLSSSNPNVFENVVSTYLAKCKGIRQLFVLRTRERDARNFVGDLLAYDLATKSYLGGFAVDVHSDGRTDQVTRTTRSVERMPSRFGRSRYQVVETSQQVAVNSDADQLRSDLIAALDEGLQKHLPAMRFIE